MALDTNIIHPGHGGTALVSKEAFDLVYKYKGWEIATPEEANAAAREQMAKIAEVRAEQAEESAKQTEAELASMGALPSEPGGQPEPPPPSPPSPPDE
jgi:hypothetical protein